MIDRQFILLDRDFYHLKDSLECFYEEVGGKTWIFSPLLNEYAYSDTLEHAAQSLFTGLREYNRVLEKAQAVLTDEQWQDLKIQREILYDN